MRTFETILVTGGAGFIGSNLIRYLFEKSGYRGRIVNVDALTYAGNLESLSDIDRIYGGKNYFFEHIDIADLAAVEKLFSRYEPDAVVHLAAESHVDRSIYGPEDFVRTNILGTFNLLETARRHWQDRDDVLFHHVSTDEVYGSLGETGYFEETTAYDPRSPYSASKASSDHLVRAYHHTYGLPITLSNCSNNYGPFQFPEKLIPVMILNMLNERPLPVYGQGLNIRDWLYVEDHNSAVWTIMQTGTSGESYNIGGDNELKNIDLVETLCELVAEEKGREKDYYKQLIGFVSDRPGHDMRYAINCEKLKNELGWRQSVRFKEGLRSTVKWYLANSEWIERIQTGEYRKWMEVNYDLRS
jgi:dTDP-glucose 4,6-dehydratase